jgi:predicted acyl esterase
MRSDRTDGLVLAYLEDVAPDGRVTYLTEGELRLLHRKTTGSTDRTGCDPAAGTRRTFNGADAAAVVPGELMYVELPLLPTAARIQRGHRLRLSLAGADAGNFAMLTETPATWSVSYGGTGGSTLKVTMKAWAPR